MKREEIQQKLLLFNRKGAMMKIRQFPDDDPITAMLDGSLTVVRVDGDAWWLSWRDAWFINGSTPGHLIKVVKTVVERTTEDQHDGELWGEVILTDDQKIIYKIEAIILGYDIEQHESWKAWDNYRNMNRAIMEEVDKTIIEAYT